MKKPFWFAALGAAASCLAAQASVAQVTEAGMGKIVPVELYVCNLVEGKGQADVDAVVAQWNAYMDEHEIDDYAAWLLTPYYYGTGQDFDMIWMGASKDGTSMGNGAHLWITEGGEVAAAFDEVMQCGVHVGLASSMYQSPPDNATPSSSIMTMSDCKMDEGTRYSDVRSAEIKWAKYRKEHGSKAGMWHWSPSFGGGDQDYDYKIVYAYPDFRELGKDWDMIANGGGRDVSSSLFDGLDDCDDERVYVARSVRAAQLRK